MIRRTSGYDMISGKSWIHEMPSILLLCQLLFILAKLDAALTNSPIVIVNNNHNNHPVGSLLNTPHFIFNNVSSSDGSGEPNPDPGPNYDAELTTPVLPAASSAGNPNTGSILTLDEPVNASSLADPFSALFFTDQQIPVHLMQGSSGSSSSNTTTAPLLPTHSPPIRLPHHYATLLKNSSSSSTTTTDPVSAAGSDHKLRWIDYRSRPSPAFPPRVPGMVGIPSGFRNPPSSTPIPPPPSAIPSYPSPSVVSNPHVNPQLVHGFGPSSTNPVGFAGSVPPAPASFPASNVNQDRKRPMPNITRVEHIAAECSDDYMKVTIHYNGTFTGLVYSSGYVHDPNCIYVNGTGRNHYEFFIRLNQCGTLGRQEMYHPKRPGEVRRRDQVMWNTLSIQYNPMIEEEWDEHYRVTCEYGSDFWKTVTFPAVNVEVNTGSPVVFTINPPQCQMEVRRGFGTAGSRTSGPVTVGDPLTLLIHMKSEKAGFDILVKNCIAHNGAQQRLQLIDPNGCVTNEKLISPFRGTYNSDDGHQVSLYAYLKAFRFTGSPALYLECDIHMCHNKCPPQRCYWRNLSKRSVRSVDESANDTSLAKPVISESISLFQALEVRHESEDGDKKSEEYSKQVGPNSGSSLCFRPDGVAIFGLVTAFILIAATTVSVTSFLKMRRIRRMYEMQNEGSLYKNALSHENLCYANQFNRRRF